MTEMLSPCDCTKYNGGQCFNCLNGAHRICDSGQGECNRTNQYPANLVLYYLKPLQWEREAPLVKPFWMAQTIMGPIRVFPNKGKVRVEFPGGHTAFANQDIEAGKKFAEDWYQMKLVSALEPAAPSA